MHINVYKYMYILVYIDIYVAMLTLYAFDPRGTMVTCTRCPKSASLEYEPSSEPLMRYSTARCD